MTGEKRKAAEETSAAFLIFPGGLKTLGKSAMIIQVEHDLSKGETERHDPRFEPRHFALEELEERYSWDSSQIDGLIAAGRKG